ncbi:unnamed protein product [Zymoseptoria tritici ST99CH_1E4]|uniref:Uncharacterized protein n=1 Tax=Zymoseptoria tritici ST99CH_1E4 TaxID=1276532 RepID=A0A2H1H4M1_ZYMTR|nr:unnamed protein product [Zymoseptoria tritici ST99CH_1E4]
MLSYKGYEISWPCLKSKPVRGVLATILFLISASLLLHFQTSTPAVLQEDTREPIPDPPKGRLHLLIPATSTNSDLCKLLLSAQILGYPTPVLINYGDHEEKDPYKQHLGKVEGILKYLEQIESNDEYAEDLVLIIDGFDVWFQLRPDVLIQRYYDINAAADARAVATYGQELVDEHDIRQTVIFGPDKICWPVDFSRPACWAVPQSPFPDSSFGPRSTKDDADERDRNAAQWLNSGTVMGPARDMRDVFKVTLEEIQSNYHGDSDQYYFSGIFGDQEYARIQRVPHLLEAAKERSMHLRDREDFSNGFRFEPLLFGKMKEHHIGIDYSLSMFQTLAFWRQHLSWIRASDIWTPPASSPYPPSSAHFFSLPADVSASTSPYAALKSSHPQRNTTWSEVPLAFNSITHQIPALLHVTGGPHEKEFRRNWWQKLWFQSHARELREASLSLDQKRISNETMWGYMWYNAEADEIDREGIVGGGLGGVWTDRRGWLSWKRVCGRVEGEIFDVPDQEWFHPGPKWPETELEPELEMDERQNGTELTAAPSPLSADEPKDEAAMPSEGHSGIPDSQSDLAAEGTGEGGDRSTEPAIHTSLGNYAPNQMFGEPADDLSLPVDLQ